MQKRQILLTRMLKISLLKSYKTYPVLGTQFLKSGGKLQKSTFPCINSHNFSTQSDSVKALFELGKDNKAFASIKKELSLNPQDEDLHEILINKLELKSRLEEDLESFYKQVIEMMADPESISSFYFTSADVLVKQEKFPQALLAYREAMKSNPPMSSRLSYKYGEVLQHEGLYEEALIQFEQVKKGPKPNEDVLFWTKKYQGNASNGAAYMDYCLGRVQKAKEEFEKMIADEAWTPLTKWNYLLILYHLEDEEMINRYKENELKGWFPLSWGAEWIQLFEQESKITKEIIERGDLDENMRKFNKKKLEALNHDLLPFLRQRIREEEIKQEWSW